MQWIMSSKLCEAWVKMRIRSECRTLPRRSANLWLDRAKPRSCEVESVWKPQYGATISKRQYGMETEGNPTCLIGRMKSDIFCANASGYKGSKSGTSVEGAASGKMRDQTHKDSHPDMGCSGAPRGAMCNTVDTDAVLPQRQRGELGMRGT